MMKKQLIATAFREGDEVVLAEGSYQGTLGVFLRLREDLKWATSRSATAKSAATLWNGLPTPRMRFRVPHNDSANRPCRDFGAGECRQDQVPDQASKHHTVWDEITRDQAYGRRYRGVGRRRWGSSMYTASAHLLTDSTQVETMKMKIRPLYDRIVVKRIEEQETTRNGIVIPDSAKEKPQEGEVIAVGHGKRLEDGKLIALDVNAGDRILFAKYSGSDTKVDGTEYIIMREEDVLGILDTNARSTKQPS